MDPSRRETICGACSLVLVGCAGPSTPVSPDPGPPTIVPDPTGTPEPGEPDPCAVEPGTSAEGWVRFGLADHPQLREVLGAAYVAVDGEEIVIAQVEPDCFAAVERACTHEGVLVDYVPSRNGLVCPRHGAIYAMDGRVLAGPTLVDLVRYETGVRDDAVWVRRT